MDRTEVLERLRPLTSLRTREVEHGPRTRVQVLPEQVVFRPAGSAALTVAPEGVRALARFAQFPANLPERLSHDTLGRVATELLARRERYTLLISEGQVVDFGRGRACPALAAERVLRVVERSLDGAEFNRVLVIEQSARLEVMGAREEAVARGDLVRAGAVVTFSPVGTALPSVQSYVVRLACTNGATSDDVLRNFQWTGGGATGRATTCGSGSGSPSGRRGAPWAGWSPAGGRWRGRRYPPGTGRWFWRR